MEPDNLKIAEYIAKCYLRTNIDKKEALFYMEKAFLTNPNPSPDIIFEYGQALTYHLRFDEAKTYFQQYKNLNKGDYQKKVDLAIKNCDASIELIQKPLNISFTNLGENVNSSFDDYYPFVSKNDSTLYFTSRRKGNLGGSKEFDGLYPSDIYSYLLHNPIAKAKNLGKAINTTGDDQVVGLSNDGRTLFIYFDMIEYYGDLYMAINANGRFSRNFKIDETVNSKYLETSGSLSTDGQSLFFASNRPGGFGGLDLYITRKLPDGTWALPQNLGKTINTTENEDFPQLSADGKTLYFSSTGHPGMGGADIFISDWNEDDNIWSSPINVGYPLNTPEDNMTISFSENDKFAYVSAHRDDSFGNLDIYRVEFHNNMSNKAVFIFTLDGVNTDETTEMVISDEQNEIIGIYHPNKKGKLVAILDVGKYSIEVEQDYEPIITESLIVSKYHTKQNSVFKNLSK